MPVLRVDPIHPTAEVLERAATVLHAGGLVAFPTETVYGLGANALDPAAVARIFSAKGRPGYNPLIAHVPDVAAARELVLDWPDSAQRLTSRFWPGPLTLVLRKRSHVPDSVTAGLPTVALRVPAHPVAHALLRTVGVPLAAPSANRFTEVSPTTAQHVENGLGDRVDLILDGGATDVGIESVVVDLSGSRPVLLRPGTIPAEQLESVIGALDRPEPGSGPTAPRASPGMLDRHYAPRAELRLFASAERNAAAAIARQAAEQSGTVGALLFAPLEAPVSHAILMPQDPAAYARGLYASLHSLDERGCDLILVERVPAAGEWAGVRDRLQRAAHPA